MSSAIDFIAMRFRAPRFIAVMALLSLLGVSVAAGGDRHFVFTPARPLTADDQATLAARGVHVQKVLADGRLLVVMDGPGSPLTSQEELPSLGTLAAIVPEAKLMGPAASIASESHLVRILFHADVTLEGARRSVAAAGGLLEEPLRTEFNALRSLDVTIDAESLERLAQDDSVLAVAIPDPLPFDEENADAATRTGVAAVQLAPFGLSGEGVTLSMFEVGRPDVAHREFQERVQYHPPKTSTPSVSSHATHVAGTLTAAGLDPRARGMAPSASLKVFIATSISWDWLEQKEKLPATGSRIDSNSWSRPYGWTSNSDGPIWRGNGQYYGAYDAVYTAPEDRISRDSGILFVHSAGNDAVEPVQGEWRHHRHTRPDGQIDPSGSWCYSKDGSGTDCPMIPCTPHPAFCETRPHMPDAPYRSIGVTASGKNSITVGSIQKDGTIAASSSRGPTLDGRLKPDLVAPGVGVYSTMPADGYGENSGTSMATPVVSGAAALVIELWRRTFRSEPVAAELKAALMATAEDLGASGPDYTFGFGLIDAKAAADLVLADGGTRRHIRRDRVSAGETRRLTMTVSEARRLRVVLHWADPEVLFLATDDPAARALVNDLDLRVIGPAGVITLPYVLDPRNVSSEATRGVNVVDNTELVEIEAATPGTYRLEVNGNAVSAGASQEFVIASTVPIHQPAPPRRRASGR